MRYLLNFAPVLLVLLVAAACTSRIPEPVSHPYSQQEMMQASRHWQILAHDLADRINNQLIRENRLDSAVYVEESCGDEGRVCTPGETSPFNEAFRDLLITDLVGYGVPTSQRPDDESTIEVRYKVQVVRHQGERVRTLQPGMLTALSAAILVLRNAPSDLLIISAGATADIANSSFNRHGHYEVIITTSMASAGRYLFRASDLYYINDRDFWHYQETPLSAKTIPLTTSGRPAAPARARPEVLPPPATVEPSVATEFSQPL